MVPRFTNAERLGRDLDLSDTEIDALFRTAPVTTSGYPDLIDAIHKPDTTFGEVAEAVVPVVAELEDRDFPESQLAITAIENRIRSITK